MAKKKKRKKGNNGSKVQITAKEFLQTFRNSWNSGNAVASLNAYRGWTRRTGKKRDPGIEGELLFRCASNDFKSQNYERALQRLQEARALDPADSSRYDRFIAVCMAKNNQIKESAELFSRLDDDFHASILMAWEGMKINLPGALFNDPAVDRAQVTRFCRAHFGIDEAGSAGGNGGLKQPALKNLDRALHLLAAKENPEPPLKLLMKKPQFEELAAHLLVMAYAFNKKIVPLSNVIKKFPGLQQDDSFKVIITGVLTTAMREKKIEKATKLFRALNEAGIWFKELDNIKDELRFQLGLARAEVNEFEAALYLFEGINQPTSPVFHNIALCYQEFEEYDNANRYWIRLLAREKKPAPCDSSEEARAYIATLKYIANNYMEDLDSEEAKKYFKEVLRLDKNDRDALYALTSICALDGGGSESSSYAKRLHLLEPDNDEYFAAYLYYVKHEGRLDEVISLSVQAMEDDARRENEIFTTIFIDAVSEKAWELRDKNPGEATRLIKLAAKYNLLKGRLLFMEGYYQYKKGKKKPGLRKMLEAVRSCNVHREEFQMAVELYNIGFKKHAVDAFEKIGGCGCPVGMDFYFNAISYLARCDDYENTIHLCDYGLAALSMIPIDAASVLFDAKKFTWASLYSSQAVESDDWPIEDGHFHLEILNKIGDRRETLAWARYLLAKAMEEEDDDNVQIYTYLVHQIETRGRFRTL